MRYAPEPRDEPNAGVPSAQPGTYVMVMTQHKEDLKTKYGLRDRIDFQGDNEEGVTVGCSLWLKGPERRDDGGMTKGNLWMYRVLAEACGPDALDQYHQTDANGHSMFQPMDWSSIKSSGHPRYFTVEVGLTRVESVSAADPEVVKSMHLGGFASVDSSQKTATTDDVGDPQNTDDGRHDTGADDDIPF